MSDLREVGSSNDPFSYWANSVTDVIREKALSKSSDILLRNTHMGSSISISPQYKYPPTFMNYCGKYDPVQSYGVNDVVRVLPDTNYNFGERFTDQVTRQYTNASTAVPPRKPSLIIGGTIYPQSAFISVGIYATNDNNTIAYGLRSDNPVVGTWICVSPIPNAFIYAELVAHMGNIEYYTEATSNSNFLTLNPFEQKNIQYLRLANVNYSPDWPEWGNVAELQRTNLTKTQGKYWELLSLLPMTQNYCSNGTTTPVLVDASNLSSGSMYPVDETKTF